MQSQFHEKLPWPQFSSSDPFKQSWIPLHLWLISIQVRFPQSNWTFQHLESSIFFLFSMMSLIEFCCCWLKFSLLGSPDLDVSAISVSCWGSVVKIISLFASVVEIVLISIVVVVVLSIEFGIVVISSSMS